MASTEPALFKTAEEETAAQERADARAARIAAAVERSKTEYQPQHAYTERGVSPPSLPATQLLSSDIFS